MPSYAEVKALIISCFAIPFIIAGALDTWKNGKYSWKTAIGVIIAIVSTLVQQGIILI